MLTQQNHSGIEFNLNGISCLGLLGFPPGRQRGEGGHGDVRPDPVLGAEVHHVPEILLPLLRLLLLHLLHHKLLP